MANKKCINFGIIFKRSSCLNSVSKDGYIDSSKSYKNLKTQLENVNENGQISTSIDQSLKYYVESLCDSQNANKYYRQPLYCLERLNISDTSKASWLLNEYTERILPYVEDLSTIGESIDRYNLTDQQKETILESASSYITADRILKNHNTISKRFNIESEIIKAKAKGLRDVVESCCSMIDTYTIKPHQKMNLCIEEMMYLFEKNNIDYDRKTFVEYVTEYFLLRSQEMSKSELDGYKIALTESHCLNEEDLENVKYLVDPIHITQADEPTISDLIHDFLISREKTFEEVSSLIRSFTKYRTATMVSNITKVIWLIWNIRKSNIFPEDDILRHTIDWFNSIVKRVTDYLNIDPEDPMCVTIEDVRTMRNDIIAVSNLLISRAEDDYDYIRAMSSFKTDLDMYLIEPLRIVLGLAYPRYNLESMDFVNDDHLNPVPLKQFKMYEFRDLIRSSNKLRDVLESKIDNSDLVVESFISKDNMSKDIFESIGEDCKADICVGQYSIDENNAEELNSKFGYICNSFNHQLKIDGIYTERAYYMINPGMLEVHVKESYPVIVEDAVRELSSKYIIAPELNYYIEELAKIEACLESYDSFTEENEIKPLKDKLVEFVENKDLTIDHYTVAMEALSLLNATKEDIEFFTDRFSDYRFNCLLESNNDDSIFISESTILKNTCDNWVSESNVPLHMQLEAYQILCAVLEDAPKIKKPDLSINKKKDDKKKEDSKEEKKESLEEIKKNPFKGINLNSLKLYLEGLKSKMKKMNQKEKEISKNMDNTFRVFVKSMKNAMISDRREAIIKGSVIPSFSKCVKIAIALAGTGLIAGEPLVPILIALGGFITSKRLTHRERLLLLDEIETELQVIEKEIQMAESKNQMKKYRALLKQKKDLQRQYQRIKYNVRVGKDLLPNSSVGVKKFDD